MNRVKISADLCNDVHRFR